MPQSLASIYLHIIFGTKNRQPHIDPAIEPRLHAYLGGIFRDHGSPALSVGGMADHVHVLCSLCKTIAVADLVEEVKKSSSKWIKTQGPEFRFFHWQKGYAAFSIGKSGERGVRAYIARQKEHHRKKTFQDELREFLRKYEVEFDERYVWD
ncbi:MAG: IS200/IS605 family transposase [Planctomycetes bacterium]|nr:IS200/IS605 family transposase [Planctomycetota bacterium]